MYNCPFLSISWFTINMLCRIQFSIQWFVIKESESDVTWHTAKYAHTLNLCSAFNPSKVHTHSSEHTHTVNTHPAVNTHTPWTHTRSSGQPFMLRRPGSSRGFGALLKGLTSVVVLKEERALYIHSPHLQSLPDLRLDITIVPYKRSARRKKKVVQKWSVK